jgi:hypothetical protein
VGSPADEKVSNQEIADAFRERLRKVAGFAHMPDPIAMRNSKNAVVYYLYSPPKSLLRKTLFATFSIGIAIAPVRSGLLG